MASANRTATFVYNPEQHWHLSGPKFLGKPVTVIQDNELRRARMQRAQRVTAAVLSTVGLRISTIALLAGGWIAGSLVIASIATAGEFIFSQPVFPNDADVTPEAAAILEKVRAGEANDPTILRSSHVRVNFSVLEGPGPIELNLFPNIFHTLIIDRRTIPSASKTFLTGHLEGVAYSSVLLRVKPQRLNGKIHVEGHLYQVHGLGHGLVAIRELHLPPMEDDQPIVPSEEELATLAQAVPESAPEGLALEENVVSQSSAALTREESPPVVDVLVVYTPEAAAEASSIGDLIEDNIEDTIDEINQMLVNSDVSLILNLLGMQEIAYTPPSGEEKTYQYLKDLREKTDGQDGPMDIVHQWRNEVGADLVQLWVHKDAFRNDPGGFAGRANAAVRGCPDPLFDLGNCSFLETHPVGIPSKGFSVTRLDRAMKGYVAAHEFGHNLGLQHDRDTAEDKGATGANWYSYGYRSPDPADNWRTIMAYPEKNANGNCIQWCTRVGFFSNPRVLTDSSIAGFPTDGEPMGSKRYLTSNYKSRGDDNALTLQYTGPVVANFRPRVSHVTPLDGRTFLGVHGGVFEPTHVEYTITNPTFHSLEYVIGPMFSDQPWLTVIHKGHAYTSEAPLRLVLGEGSEETIQVVVNHQVIQNLSVGLHEGGIAFINETGNFGTTMRPVQLNLLESGNMAVNAAELDMVAVGPEGGPFERVGGTSPFPNNPNPACWRTGVSNIGGNTIEVAVSTPVNWITLDFRANGWGVRTKSFDLQPGWGTGMGTCLDLLQASALPPGEYTAAVEFRNLTNKRGNTARTMRLTVQKLLEVLTPTPFTPSGYEGGPFSPDGNTYTNTATIINRGTSQACVDIQEDVSWLVIMGDTTRCVAPGSSIKVPVALTDQALALTPGIYTTPIRYSQSGRVLTTKFATITVLKPARILTPTPGSELNNTTITFTGDHIDGEVEHWLWVGTQPNSSDIGYSKMSSAHTATISGLPTSGTIFVSYRTKFADGAQQIQNHTYTMNVTPNSITSPVEGSTINSSPITFEWTSGSGVTSYWLAVYALNNGQEWEQLYSASQGIQRTSPALDIPLEGRPIMATLIWQCGAVECGRKNFHYKTATTYEDAENGNTSGWEVYDANPAGATITNVYDSTRQSRVIELKGSGNSNGYRLWNQTKGQAWNNTSQFVAEWSMQYAEPVTLYFSVYTTAGHRYIYYNAASSDKLLHNTKYVHHGLGAESMDGQWHAFIRDLQADLNEAEPGVQITEVHSLSIRGSGRVDDIRLHTEAPGNASGG